MDSFWVFNGFCLFREAVFLVFFGYVFSGLCYRHIQIRGGVVVWPDGKCCSLEGGVGVVVRRRCDAVF